MDAQEQRDIAMFSHSWRARGPVLPPPSHVIRLRLLLVLICVPAFLYLCFYSPTPESFIGKTTQELDVRYPRAYELGPEDYDSTYDGKRWDRSYNITPPLAAFPCWNLVRVENGVVVDAMMISD